MSSCDLLEGTKNRGYMKHAALSILSFNSARYLSVHRRVCLLSTEISELDMRSTAAPTDPHQAGFSNRCDDCSACLNCTMFFFLYIYAAVCLNLEICTCCS